MAQTNVTKTGSGRLLVLAILFTVFQFTAVILETISNGLNLPWTLGSVVMAVLCFLLYFSYRAHNKNVTKPLLGATLMYILSYELSWGCSNLQYIGEILGYYDIDIAFVVYCIAQILTFLVIVGINILHYVINETHQSSPGKVKLNWTLFIAFVVLVAVQAVCIFLMNYDDVLIIIGEIIAVLADIFILGSVLCIESSMDDFRIAREK